MIFVVLLAVHLFLLWCAYDCGIDTGYNRAWREQDSRRVGTATRNQGNRGSRKAHR